MDVPRIGSGDGRRAINDKGARRGIARAALREIAAAVGVRPAETTDPAEARAMLADHGCALLWGVAKGKRAFALAVRQIMGETWRAFEPLRTGSSLDGGGLSAVHSDYWAYPGVPDYLFLRVAQPAPTGGASLLVDGERVLAALAGEPWGAELVAFCFEEPINHLGSCTIEGVEPSPGRIAARLESGRLVLRRGPYQAPMAWTPRTRRLFELWEDLVATAEELAPRIPLSPNDVLGIDNMRMLHGRTAFSGPRVLHALEARSVDQRLGVRAADPRPEDDHVVSARPAPR